MYYFGISRVGCSELIDDPTEQEAILIALVYLCFWSLIAYSPTALERALTATTIVRSVDVIYHRIYYIICTPQGGDESLR